MITSSGIEIEFKPISHELLLRFNAANPQPIVPTYPLVSTLTGTTQNIPLDEKSLREKPEQFTPEQHQAWKDYSIAQAGFIKRYIKFFSLYIEPQASLSEWRDRKSQEYEFIGLSLPDNPLELKFEWLTSEILVIPEDYMMMVTGIMDASGVPTGLLTQVEELFRSNTQLSSAERLSDTAEQMESVASVGRGTGDASLPSHSKRVGKIKRTRSRMGASDTANAG